MCLSAVLMIQTAAQKYPKDASQIPFFPGKETPKRILLGFLSLIGFRYLLPIIGFGPSAGAFIFFLAWALSHYNWKQSIVFSVLTAFAAYYLFQVWLRIPMPHSIFSK
jgi:hypothetical protein